MGENFISLHPWCAVISEWNNTDDEEPRNKSAIVSATGIPYQNNEGPLQRDEVKATFNKEENNDNARKSTTRVGFLLLSHRRAPLVIFHVISTLLSSLSLSSPPPDFSTFLLFRVCKLRKLNADHERPFSFSRPLFLPFISLVPFIHDRAPRSFVAERSSLCRPVEEKETKKNKK